MSAGPAEVLRRLRGRWSGRIHSLPILALHVHAGCNCRCVMCDIWRADAKQRELSPEALAGHIDAIRRLLVTRVMLTGGEPLLHTNLWRLCDGLAAAGVRVTLVTTGLLLERDAIEVARAVDTVVVSLDGPPEVHDAIRRTRGGVGRIAEGLAALRRTARPPGLLARCVVQRDNFRHLAATVTTALQAGFDRLSFLPADVTSTAFNRPQPWSAARQSEVALTGADLPVLTRVIDETVAELPETFRNGFVVDGRSSLQRIHAYYAALAGQSDFPPVACNAPWVSAVVELDGTVRPCFFQPPYEQSPGGLAASLNQESAVRFRRALDPRRDPICQRCVCSLNLPVRSTP